MLDLLAKQGYTRSRAADGRLEVVQDRITLERANRGRLVEDLEAALKHGQGRVSVLRLDAAGAHRPDATRRFSSDLHCAECDIHYRDPVPNIFSFNSPIGACETCRGFGRTIGIDWDLVMPDDTRSLAGGAVKPWQTESFKEMQHDLLSFAPRRGVPVDVPWKRPLRGAEAMGHRRRGRVGREEVVRREAVLRMAGRQELPDAHPGAAVPLPRLHRLPRLRRFAAEARGPPVAHRRAEKLSIHDVMLLPIDELPAFFRALAARPLDEATGLLLAEIRRASPTSSTWASATSRWTGSRAR